MFISQIKLADGGCQAVFRTTEAARLVPGGATTYQLALEAAASGRPLADVIAARGVGEAVDLESLAAAGRLAPPILHPDPAHLHITGTGLTHLGSASTRDAMHAKLASGEEHLTDSMRMFRMGLDGGKPPAGKAGVQPEWFYKGNGDCLVAPGEALLSPAFAEDGGEEPEIAGIYVVDPDGRPARVGFAIGNEFSDHVTERVNYLWLAHSKLRMASVGPEIRLGPCPAHVEGRSRIRRAGAVIFDKPFLSGEANMSHTLANLEHHHFKYALFRRPGDVHIHLFGTATLSFADGLRTAPGDIFEIEAPAFGLALCNSLAVAPDDGVIAVRTL